MPSYVTPKKNTQYIFYISLVSQADTKLMQVNPTLAAADFNVATDDGAPGALGTTPVIDADFTRRVKVTLAAGEMNGDNVTFIASDAAGAEWCDLTINIQTTVGQIDDIPTTAEFEARSIVSADYTIVADLGTVQSADNNVILAHANYGNAQLVRSTTPANKLDVSATGEAGLDFNNIKDAAGAHTLTNITVPVVAATTDVTNDVGITQAGADKAWGTAVRVLTANTNLNDPSAATIRDAILDDATRFSGANIDAAISTRAPANEYNAEMARITANVATEAKQDIMDTNIDQIETVVITNAAGADIAADIIVLKAETAAIKVITDALTAAAAAKLALSAGTIVTGTVSWDNTNATTTIFYSDDITEATADHFNGRIVIFTSGALQYQATDITDYALDTGEGKFTVTALTEPPADNVTFIIV